MGGAVSAGVDNDELIDNLLEANYITSSEVERVFRAVDRGHYFSNEYKERAYRDLAWKCGNLHISAPCIYSRVMESLKLGPGMSFLNLGSGTGYLSTMAGLLLGSNGINHGIEIHEDVIDYSASKLNEFILTSSAIDEYEFCEPKFIHGNCLYLGSYPRQYDRVYCGAACPENHERYMKNLIKVGGILVMPINDQLLQISRTSDTNWETKAVLPVSFATLISGQSADSAEPLKMPETDPLSLQDICCFAVRSILRRNIDVEHPELKEPPRVPRKRTKKKNSRALVMPIFSSHSDGDDDQDSNEGSLTGSQQFLMDINNSQACRSIMEWSHLLQGTSAQLLQTMESKSSGGPAGAPDNGDQVTQAAGEAKSTDPAPGESSCDSILDEMPEEDFVELHNILIETERPSLVQKRRDTGCGKTKQFEECPTGQRKGHDKSKREKIDSGIVEDMEPGRESGSDMDLDVDDEDDVDVDVDYDDEEELDGDEDDDDDDDDDGDDHEIDCLDLDLCAALGGPCPFYRGPDSKVEPDPKKAGPKDSDPSESNKSSGSVQVNTYTTYMKEKIKLLPLPMTLKYYLNLNREL